MKTETRTIPPLKYQEEVLSRGGKPQKGWVSISQAAAFLDVERNLILSLIYRNLLPTEKIHKLKTIHLETLQTWLAENPERVLPKRGRVASLPE